MTKLKMTGANEEYILQHPDNTDVLQLLRIICEDYFRSPEGVNGLTGSRSPKNFTYYDILHEVPKEFFEARKVVLVHGIIHEEYVPPVPVLENPAKIPLHKIPNAGVLYKQGFRANTMKAFCDMYNVHGRGANIHRPKGRCRSESLWDKESELINNIMTTLRYLEQTEGAEPPNIIVQEIKLYLKSLTYGDKLTKQAYNRLMQNPDFIKEMSREYVVMRDDTFQRYGKTSKEYVYSAFESICYENFLKKENQNEQAR